MRNRARLRAEQWSDAQHAAMEYLTALRAANNEYANLASRRRREEVQHDAHLASSRRQAEVRRSEEQSGVRQRLLLTLSQANQARRLDTQSRPAASHTRNTLAPIVRLRSHLTARVVCAVSSQAGSRGSWTKWLSWTDFARRCAACPYRLTMRQATSSREVARAHNKAAHHSRT